MSMDDVEDASGSWASYWLSLALILATDAVDIYMENHMHWTLIVSYLKHSAYIFACCQDFPWRFMAKELEGLNFLVLL